MDVCPHDLLKAQRFFEGRVVLSQETGVSTKPRGRERLVLFFLALLCLLLGTACITYCLCWLLRVADSWLVASAGRDCRKASQVREKSGLQTEVKNLYKKCNKFDLLKCGIFGNKYPPVGKYCIFVCFFFY